MTNSELAKLIAGNSIHMQNLAAQAIEALRDQIAEAAEVVALKHMRDTGITDLDSDEARKIMSNAERLFISAVMRHMSNLNQFTDNYAVEGAAEAMREHPAGE